MKIFLHSVPFIAASMLSGCGKQEVVAQPSTQLQDVIPESVQKPAYSIEDWRRDFTSAFVQTNKKSR